MIALHAGEGRRTAVLSSLEDGGNFEPIGWFSANIPVNNSRQLEPRELEVRFQLLRQYARLGGRIEPARDALTVRIGHTGLMAPLEDKPTASIEGEMTIAPIELLFDLSQVGVDVDDLWELVETREPYGAAVPVLVDWLAHLDERVAPDIRARVEEPIVRALAIPAARKTAPPVLLERFRPPQADPNRGVRWVIGNALGALAGDQYFDQIAALARDEWYGRDREQLMRFFGRSKDPRAVPLLIELLEDGDVVAHAAEALGRQKDPRSRAPLERLRTHSLPLVRREAEKALKKLR